MSFAKSLLALPKLYWDGLKQRLKSVKTYVVAGLMVLAAILAVVGLVLYKSIEGTSAFILPISEEAVSLYVAGIVVSLVIILIPFKIVYALDACLLLAAPLLFLSSQASFVSNVFVGIDGQSFSAAFILGALLPIISVVLTFVASALLKEPKLFSEDEEVEVVVTTESEEGEEA